MEIEIDLTKDRVEFEWRFSPLVINPREDEYQVHKVPLSRVIDECGDADAEWFAFFEENCFDPPIYLVRARSWEQAYEDFCDQLTPVDLSDLDEDQRAMVEDTEGNLPDGYAINSSGHLVHTESVMGYQTRIVSIQCAK